MQIITNQQQINNEVCYSPNLLRISNDEEKRARENGSEPSIFIGSCLFILSGVSL